MRVSLHCQGCDRTGTVKGTRGGKKPSWCRCKGVAGPFHPPAGVVYRYTFETTDAASFRERGRLLGNAYIEARDALSGRWVRCGRGWRELPRGNAKRERLEAAFAKAKRDLAKHQRACSHPTRSMFAHDRCDVCHAHVAAARAA